MKFPIIYDLLPDKIYFSDNEKNKLQEPVSDGIPQSNQEESCLCSYKNGIRERFVFMEIMGAFV